MKEIYAYVSHSLTQTTAGAIKWPEYGAKKLNKCYVHHRLIVEK